MLINMGLSLFFFSCFYHRIVVVCFVAYLLWREVLLSIISFFVGFCVDILDDKVQSDRIIRSNHVYQYVKDLKS